VALVDAVGAGKANEVLLAPAVTALDVKAAPAVNDDDVSNSILDDVIVDDESLSGTDVDVLRSVELGDKSEIRVVETVKNEEVELSSMELSFVFGRVTGMISIVVGKDAIFLVVFWNGAACLNELIS